MGQQLALASSLYTPLAERLRPQRWEDFVISKGFDRKLIESIKLGRRPPPLILWGPPGSGKTTFARLICSTLKAHFVEASAVLVGIGEVRALITDAQKRLEPTVLFIDEIHRFNKAQQDALLPHVERGTILLVGATTENPSFYCTGALLSRCHVVVFGALDSEGLEAVLGRALSAVQLSLSEAARRSLIQLSGGDTRRIINLVEFLSARVESQSDVISDERVRSELGSYAPLRHDKKGDEHYQISSAFIKSMRGSDPDAALFWCFRLIEAGEDPRFVIRRMMIFASEDIGNADPRALLLATATADAFDRLGMPEGRIPIGQCVTYLACAAKSNRSYVALERAIEAVKSHPDAEVPLHLRNAPTEFMKSKGFGEGYEYPHDNPTALPSAGVRYLPDGVDGGFYEPSNRGVEQYFRRGDIAPKE